MVVTDCAIGRQIMTTDGARDLLVSNRNAPAGALSINAVDQLRAVAGLCNAGEFDATTKHLPLSLRKIHGDATDQAILRFAEGLEPIEDLKRAWSTKFDLAFNSKNKFMMRVLGMTNPSGLASAVPGSIAAVFEPRDM